jgi:hypothetical protein
MMSISDQMAILGSDSQSTVQPDSPTLVSRPLIAPLVWSMRPQPVPTITSDIT